MIKKIIIFTRNSKKKMNKTYLETRGHCRSFIRYHFIFSTKYRKKCFVGFETELRSVFKWVEGRCAFKILKVGVDQDHVHLLVKGSPALSIDQIARRLKQLSTREMWRLYYPWLSRFYYHKKKNLWAGGYFCSTIGQISEEKVMEYIENQGS